MEIGNVKLRRATNICKFPQEQNLNTFPLAYFSGKLEIAKRNKFWIGFTLVVVYVFSEMIQYRLSLGPLTPISIEHIYEMSGFILLIGVGLGIVLVAGLTFGRSAPSGRTRITRSSAESVDGFGGARARDFSYSPPSHSSKGGFPVSLRQKRKRTATFREGAKDHDDERSGESS